MSKPSCEGSESKDDHDFIKLTQPRTFIVPTKDGARLVKVTHECSRCGVEAGQ